MIVEYSKTSAEQLTKVFKGMIIESTLIIQYSKTTADQLTKIFKGMIIDILLLTLLLENLAFKGSPLEHYKGVHTHNLIPANDEHR